MENYLIAFALGAMVTATINYYLFLTVQKIGKNKNVNKGACRVTVRTTRPHQIPPSPNRKIGFRKESSL